MHSSDARSSKIQCASTSLSIWYSSPVLRVQIKSISSIIVKGNGLIIKSRFYGNCLYDLIIRAVIKQYFEAEKDSYWSLVKNSNQWRNYNWVRNTVYKRRTSGKLSPFHTIIQDYPAWFWCHQCWMEIPKEMIYEYRSFTNINNIISYLRIYKLKNIIYLIGNIIF